jgi:peroxiredoxin
MRKLAIILFLSIQFSLVNNLSALGTTKLAYASKFTEIPKRADTNAKADSLTLNTPAPEFSLRDLKGKLYSLKNLKGKIVVLNFWFIACKPCVNEMPVLNAIKKSYGSDKIVFLALALDQPSAIHAFLKDHPFEYTILPGAKKTAENYNLNAYPASVVIDKKGIIRFIQIGGPNIGQNLANAIERL